LLGGSGTGKSVILRSIIGLEKPDRGQIIFEDSDITKLKEKELFEVRKKIGYAFQNGALFDSMTVEENIRLPLEECSCLNEKEISARVKSVSQMLHLDAWFLKKNCAQLSGGERKLVAIGRAIINNPTYLLYDEPTTGLDPITHDKICDVIKELNKPGILVTHNLNTIRKIDIKTIYQLQSGKLTSLCL
ncbi:MAG: ATP-binding cassette domain-containing protein, partial [candidate division WOR-3 bacterium]|nr:ATP-binding cassette domain-containing protein [candidate division WOR-3 bacterium]